MTPYEPCVARILSEVGGDKQAAVNRLLALHWEEGEAVEEIDRCRAALSGGRRVSKRAGARG